MFGLKEPLPFIDKTAMGGFSYFTPFFLSKIDFKTGFLCVEGISERIKTIKKPLEVRGLHHEMHF